MKKKLLVKDRGCRMRVSNWDLFIKELKDRERWRQRISFLVLIIGIFALVVFAYQLGLSHGAEAVCYTTGSPNIDISWLNGT